VGWSGARTQGGLQGAMIANMRVRAQQVQLPGTAGLSRTLSHGTDVAASYINGSTLSEMSHPNRKVMVPSHPNRKEIERLTNRASIELKIMNKRSSVTLS
jgi:hypothetical protein